MQSCFGKYWEGKNDGPCKEGKGCSYFHDCLAIFARDALLKAQQSLGPSASPSDIGNSIGVSPESVLLAVNFQKNVGIVPVYSEKIEPVVTTVEKVKPKKAKRTKKKRAPLSKPRGSQFDQIRWERERKRYPVIAMLTPGMKLERKYKGVVTETIVRKGYYSCNGIAYPTLYAAMVSITGTKSYKKQKRPDGTRPKGTREMTTMSAVRFYKLKERFGITKRAKKKKVENATVHV